MADDYVGERNRLRQRLAELDSLAERLTVDDVKGMSEADINARWPDVQAVLAGDPPPSASLTAEDFKHLERLTPEQVNAHWPEIAEEMRRRGQEGGSS